MSEPVPDPATATPGTRTTRPRRRPSGIELQPPKDSDVFSTHSEWETAHELERSNAWHHLPLLLVALPPLLSIVHGRAENWSDAILLLLVAFYLYQLVKVPWEMYHASTTRTVLPDSTSSTGPVEDPSVSLQRSRSALLLRRNELISLLSTFLVPVVGSQLLHYVRGLLSDPDRYVNDSLINMFMIATSVKPFLHLVHLLKHHSLYHQELVHYPSTKVHHLETKLAKLESDLVQLSKAFATKSDVRALRDGVDVPLSQLSKAVKRFNRKEEYLRLTSEEKFLALETKFEELVEVSTRQQESLEQVEHELDQRKRSSLKGQIDFANFLGRLLGSITTTTTSPSVSTTSGRGQPIQPGRGGKRGTGERGNELGWYEKGLTWYLFWPVNVPKTALGWVVEKMGKTVKGIEEGFIEEKEELRGLGTPYPRKRPTTTKTHALRA